MELPRFQTAGRNDVSFWVRARNERALERFALAHSLDDSESLGVFSIVVEAIVEEMARTSIPRRIDLSLLALGRRVRGMGLPRCISDSDFPLLFCTDQGQVRWMLKELERRGWIDLDPSPLELAYVLTGEGWKRMGELEAPQQESNQVFVAMWFDRSMDELYEKGIAPAAVGNGYEPVRVDRRMHNEKICDYIVSEIKRSRFLIADVTGQRPSVYYEAGLAKGWGMPVIWLCREDDLSNCHFDTRQYNHIAWRDPSSLKSQLMLRIEATIGAPFHARAAK